MIPFVTGGDGSTFYAITCNDYGTRRPAADYLPLDEANGALNPGFFGAVLRRQWRGVVLGLARGGSAGRS